MKATTEEILRGRTALYALKMTEAGGCRFVVASKDSTITDLRRIAANEEERRKAVEQQYRELDKRTVPKSSLPWVALGAFILGFLVAK